MLLLGDVSEGGRYQQQVKKSALYILKVDNS